VTQIPENILRRSAEARAKKEGRPVDEILAEMKGEAPPSDSSSSDSSSSDSSPSGGGGSGEAADGGGQASTAPVPGADVDGGGQAPPAPAPSSQASDASAVSGAALLTAVAAARKMPESLVQRSATARSKTGGGSVDDVLLEWAKEEGIDISTLPDSSDASPSSDSSPLGGGGSGEAADEGGQAPTAPAPSSSAPQGGGAGQTSTAPAPSSDSVAPVAAPATAGTAVAVIDDEVAIEDDTIVEDEPDLNGAKSDRLLTVIRAGDVQRIRSAPADRVTVWPHLLAIEFVALLVVLTLLITLAIFLDAPLLEFANFNEQPNPSKAPWYFLGLQELLAYFDPQVAGIIIPTFGAIAIAIIPYIDKNPSVRPSHRKLAIMIFTFFIMAAAVLTIFGSFFRGPGFNFTFPWEDGIFFDDLKSLLE